MKATIFVILTLIKAVVIIYFFGLIIKNIYLGFKKDDGLAKRKALKYFFLLFAIIIGISVVEFGIRFLLDSD